MTALPDRLWCVRTSTYSDRARSDDGALALWPSEVRTRVAGVRRRPNQRHATSPSSGKVFRVDRGRPQAPSARVGLAWAVPRSPHAFETKALAFARAKIVSDQIMTRAQGNRRDSRALQGTTVRARAMRLMRRYAGKPSARVGLAYRYGSGSIPTASTTRAKRLRAVSALVDRR